MSAELLEWLAATPLSRTISASGTLFPWLEVTHVIAISLVLGTIVVVDLRLMGVASNDLRVSYLLGRLVPITWIAFGLAAGSGALLFLAQPVAYSHNVAFRLKLALLLAAATNMLVFHGYTQRDVHRWDLGTAPPVAAKAAGVLSIAVWIGIAAAARWIGFTLTRF